MRLLRPALAVAAVVAGWPLLVAAPAHAAEAGCTLVTDRTMTSDEVEGPSTPYDLLGIAAATQQVTSFAPPSPTVRVAVVDTGVREPREGDIPIATVKQFVTGEEDDVVDGGGTEVAGLVAAAARGEGEPVGFAPQAEIVDVQVATVRDDESSSTTDGIEPDPARVAAGLQWVAEQAKTLNIKVATVAYGVPNSSDLQDAVRAAQDAGVVVVAATGDKPEESTATETETESASPSASTTPQPDAAGREIRPAGYEGVVGVSSTAGGLTDGVATDYVLPSSDTTVAVPTYGGVSYAVNGRSCLVDRPSTSAATGEVAGVLALLWQRFPHDQPRQIVARLVNTASGTTDDPTLLTGAGIVQPLEALTRPLDPAKNGDVERAQPVAGPDGPVSPPSTPTDLLAATRDDAVWWALIGGGLVVVALLLRPVLARRRPDSR